MPAKRCLLFTDGLLPELNPSPDSRSTSPSAKDAGDSEQQKPPRKRGKRRRRSKSSVASLRKCNSATKPSATSDTDSNVTNDTDHRNVASVMVPPPQDSLFQRFLHSVETHPGTVSDRLNRKHRHFDTELAEAWSSKLSKKQRRLITAADKARIEAATAATRNLRHNFDANPDDHCETSAEAYADIAPLLAAYASSLGKTPAELQIYDPYFCAGSVKKNLGKLGFTNVYNENEDFYAQIAKNAIPKFDILVTNPPYSRDHVLKLLDFVASRPEPHLLCMPNYVLVKPEYRCGHSEVRGGQRYLAIVPEKRYMYWTPKGLRGKDKTQNHASSRGFRTSPFLSFWYVGLKQSNDHQKQPFDENFVRKCYSRRDRTTATVHEKDTLPKSYQKDC